MENIKPIKVNLTYGEKISNDRLKAYKAESELKRAVKNNKDKLMNSVDSMLEKSTMPEDKKNKVKEYVGLALNVVEHPTMLKDLTKALQNSKAAKMLEESATEKLKGNKFKAFTKLARAVIASPELLRFGYNLRQAKKEAGTVAPQEMQGQIPARGAHTRKVLEERKTSQDTAVNIPTSEKTFVGKLKTKLFGKKGNSI